MNTPLREEMLQICTYHSDDGTSGYLITPEQADQILSLVASKMPEKKLYNIEHENQFELSEFDGFNKCLTEVKSILKGGTDE